MGRLNVGGDIDILTSDLQKNIKAEDYATWIEGCELTDTIKSSLEDGQIVNLENAISEQVSANMYYLTLHTREGYNIFGKDTKFGSVYDIVGEKSKEPKMRMYFARLDIVLEMLYEKYPEDVIKISKLLQKEDFVMLNESELKIGEYVI